MKHKVIILLSLLFFSQSLFSQESLSYSASQIDSLLSVSQQGGCAFFTIVTTTDAPSCNDFTDGQVCVDEPLDGVGPYSYIWVGGPMTQCWNALGAGTYTIIVIDTGTGQSCSQDVFLNEPGDLTVFTMNATPPSCFGVCDGGAFPLVIGGNGGNMFSYSSGEMMQAASMLCNPFTLNITDSEGCTFDTTYTYLDEPDPITIDPVITDIDCFGNLTGSIEITINGGIAPFDVAWVGPGTYTSTDEDIFMLGVGTYTATITDDNDCVYSEPFMVMEPPLLEVNFTQVNNACFGESNGDIDVTVTGGTMDYNYSWTGPGTFVSIDEDIFNLENGTYDLTVTDMNGCMESISVDITSPDEVMFNEVVTDITCFGFDNGSIEITIMGGTMPYGISWVGPAPYTSSDEDIFDLGPGDYTVTILDGNLCTIEETFTILEPDAIEIDPTIVTNVSCIGDSDGAIDITITGGTVSGAYGISWVGPIPFTSNMEDISGLEIGTYTVTVTDDNDCVAILSVDIEDPLPVTIIETITNVSCGGLPDGAIDIDVSGGAAPYSFDWTGPATFSSMDEDISGLLPGDYDLIVTDDNDCVFLFSYTVIELDGYTLDFDVTDVACFGDSTGAIDMIISGGVAPFNINWTGPGTFTSMDEDISNLVAGTYTVDIIDADLCAKNVDVEVLENDSIIIDLDITPPTCTGDMDGAIDATVTGGVMSYDFSWTGPSFSATTEDISGLTAGTYFLLLTDALNCVQLVSADLIDPLAITIDGLVTDLLCFEDSTGAIDVTITNAVAPYMVSWSGPSSFTSADEDVTDLIPGNYTITVSDANGCVQIETFEVAQPGELIVNATVIDVTCFGPNTGAITLEVSGGTTDYNFNWTGPGTFTSSDEDILGLETGTYDLVLTDMNGCVVIASYFVDETPPITLDALVTNISCFGENDGSIDLTIMGGTIPYTINWTGPGMFTSNDEDIFDLLPSTYTVVVEDIDGCSETGVYEIIEPAVLDLLVNISDPSCPFDDGSLEAFPSGGTQPYTIEWSFFLGAFISNDSLIDNLSPGSYEVSVIDLNGCMVGDTITISHPSPAVTETITPVTCPGGMDGAIDLEIITDNPPVDVSWTGPGTYTSTDEDISGLEAGFYTVDVVDQALCVVSLIIEVPILPPIEIDAVVSNIACAGNNDGAIDLTITNASAPYDVMWTGPGTFTSNNEDIFGLEPGTYSVVINDANGCMADSTFEITEGLGIELDFDITDVSCINAEDGAIDMTILNGTAPFNLAWFGPNLFSSNDEDIFDLEPGEYTLNIIDANICFTDTILVVEEPDSILLGISLSPSLCSYSDQGSIELSNLGGNPPYDIIWTGPGTFSSTDQDIFDLFPGSYDLVISDDNGCTEDSSLVLLAPDTIMVSYEITNPTCLLNNGEIIAIVNGGTVATDYAYEWFDGLGMSLGNNDTLSDIFSGTYELVIIDDNLCTDTFSVSISDENYTVDEEVTNITCGGFNDGSIELTITGAQLPIFITWSGPGGFASINEDIFDLAPGIYEVTILDAIGCNYFNSYEITEPDIITIDALVTNPPCFGTDNGSIEIDVAGGSGIFDFSWTGPVPFTSADEDIFDLAGGAYDLVVNDTGGCSATDSYDLTIPTDILDTGTNISDPLCAGVNSGFIDLNINGGLAPYDFSWVGPIPFTANTEDILNLEAGDYTVSVIDSLGCLAEFSYSLSNATAIDITADIMDVTCFGFDDGAIDIVVLGGMAPYSFDWMGPNSFTSTDQNVIDCVPGPYILTIVDDNNCENTFSFNIETPDTLDVSFNITDPSCSYLNNGAIDIEVNGGTVPYDISWVGPNTFTSDQQDIGLLEAGNYSLTVTDSLMCIWQGDTTLVSPPAIQVQLDSILDPFCTSSPDGTIFITAGGGTGILSYQWTGPLAYSSIDEDAMNVTAGTFDIEISDENSCSLDTFFIVTPQIFVVADAGSFGELCDGDTITLDGSGSIAADNFEWVIDGTIVSNDEIFNYPIDLATSVVILNIVGSTCTDSDTLNLSVNELPFVDAGLDQIAFFEDLITIGGDPTTDIDNMVLWMPNLNLNDSTLFNPVATIIEDQWYFVTANSVFGCISSDSVFIDLQAPVDIPNTITPNDDGYNDTWVLDGSLNFPNMEVEVYNRWGELLFSSLGYGQVWDGTFEGNDIPVGTYYYVIRLNDPMFPDHFSGPISIMR